MPYATEFTQFNPRCSGKFVVPFGCSGLVILSKYPIEFAGIRPFRYALCQPPFIVELKLLLENKNII